jgi:hypothetical protein
MDFVSPCIALQEEEVLLLLLPRPFSTKGFDLIAAVGSASFGFFGLFGTDELPL